MQGTTMNWQGAVVKNRSVSLNAKALALAALVSISAGGFALAADLPTKAAPTPTPKASPFFFVNDTSVSFTWFPSATDPGVAGSAGSVLGGVVGTHSLLDRYDFSIDHFDVWEYGTNLIHLDYNMYSDNDPILGVPHAQGDNEFDGFFRSTLGLNELTHSKAFSNPLFTDLGIEFGGFVDIQSNYLSANTKQYDIGVNINLNLPGTVLLGVLAQKEYAHNNFDNCGNVSFGVASNGACNAGFGGPYNGDRYFHWTPKLELFVSEPLKFLPWPVTFIDVTNVTFPKGTGISSGNTNALAFPLTAAGVAAQLANEETKVEVFQDARLTLDASKVFWSKPGIWDTYIGYRYWYNKFGTDHNAPLFSQIAPSTSIESSAYIGTTYHFK
jgi:hypothetical protein